MVETSGKIMRYSNVSWIDNKTAVKRKSSPELLASTPKHQRSNFSLDKNQEASSTDESPIFANFRPFEPTQDFSHPSQSTSRSRSDSILSSAPSSSESLNRTFPTATNSSAAHRSITYSQGKVFAEPQALIASDQPLPISFLQLFGLLSVASNSEPTEPKTYKQAISNQNPKQQDWKQAMQEEIDSLLENETWILTSLPPRCKALDGKWVYKIKRGPEGEIQHYKARWVVRGFQQKEGIDYAETFASVVKLMSYKAIFALACANNWEIHQMDVKTAFLYGLIEGEVYVNQPHGFNDGTTRVCRLLRALYGLKQSPRVWYDTLVAFLKSYGMSPLNADLSIYTKPGLMIAIFVDDLLITGGSIPEIKAAKAAFHACFQMSDLGLCKYYLGMTVTRDCKNRILRLGQRAYLEKILVDHQMMDCKPAPTPIESQHLTVAAVDYQPDEHFVPIISLQSDH